MDLSQIRELLKIVSESGVAEVEIEEDDFKLVVRRNTPNVSIQAPPSYQVPPYQVPPQQPATMPYYPPSYPPVAPQAPAAIQHVMPQQQSLLPQQPAAPPVPEAAPAIPSAPAPTPAQAPASNEHTIKAPIVGTFYRAPSPDSDPFVSVGDRVNPGDVLCIIEAMKLMNEIESEVSGVIKQVLLENSQPVEYDQPLFVIEEA